MMLRKKINEVLLILTENSACVTSILRTYYTWRTVKSSDTSWELLLMGLWSWAELSIGIIVGCLPALSKFFQHIGPKIHGSISGVLPGSEPCAAMDTSKAKALARVKKPFAKYGVGASVSDSWNDPYSPSAQLHDDYLVLDSFDGSLSQAKVFRATAEGPGQGTATAREELEYLPQRA